MDDQQVPGAEAVACPTEAEAFAPAGQVPPALAVSAPARANLRPSGTAPAVKTLTLGSLVTRDAPVGGSGV